jgi:hypothetical protein
MTPSSNLRAENHADSMCDLGHFGVNIAGRIWRRNTTHGICQRVVRDMGANHRMCDMKDESNIVISEKRYIGSDKNCSVQVIVETAGALGPNYSVRALCADQSDPSKTNIANLIIRPQNNDRISVGKAFDELKSYHRCPVK